MLAFFIALAINFIIFARYSHYCVNTMAETNEKELLQTLTDEEYKYGFTTDIETELIEKGLSE